jgi:Flp pilus assembly protein TadG
MRMAPPRLLRLKRFAEDRRGVAAVEFALILPFLLLLFLGSIEASSLITVDRRINVISGTVGDLVAQQDPGDDPLTDAILDDYFEASEAIIYPYSTTGLEQVVSLVEVAADGTATVEWSCGYNGGVKRTANSAYTLPANMNLVARPPDGSGYVVASETSYSYLPALGLVFTEAIELNRASYYLPRFREAITGPAC